MNALSPDHFLSLPRPDANLVLPAGVPDTSTLAAHDFDVDTRTGFMPPHPPLSRLSIKWELWEAALDLAMRERLQLGEKVDPLSEEAVKSEEWRAGIRSVSRHLLVKARIALFHIYNR